MFQNDKNIIYNELSKPKVIDRICHHKNNDLGIEYSGSFIFGPLTHNFGLTIGNALRRVILSSSYGLAIIGFSVNSIDHEFNNLHGIIEDSIEIGLNLKSLRFVKNHTVIFDGFLEVDVKGPCQFTAAMLESLTDNKVKVVDKNLVICNITSDSIFRFVFQITSGRGYVSSSFFKCFDNQRNLIFLDALFSSVKKVSFNVENFIHNGFEAEKLILNVETDCGADYNDVISDAFLTLASVFSPFFSDSLVNFQSIQQQKSSDADFSLLGQESRTEYENNIEYIVSSSGMKYNINLFRTIHEIIIPVRAHNAFVKTNITYLGDLVKMSMRDLTSMANLGRKSLETVIEILKKFGLKLEMDIQWPPVDLANLRKQCELKFNLSSENN